MNDWDREAQIAGTLAFIRKVGERAAAEFIVDLQLAVDGLTRNNTALAAAFRKAPQGGAESAESKP